MLFRKRADSANNTIPLPIALTASGDFDGNDGKWSTFFINIGDDASGRYGQNFKVLISTSSPITLVPQQAEWCNQDCAEKRGVMPFNGDQTLGFRDSSSQAWKDAGIYSIPTPHWWSWDELNGTWGSENVGLGESSPESLILTDQFVVEYTFKEFFLGSFGLAVGPVNPGSGAKNPFLATFKSANIIPSASYGYTAGAYYRNNGKGTVGDLILGGYDQSRVELDRGVSIHMPNERNNSLVVGVQSILYKPDPDIEANTFSFTSESKGFFATIDSTLPYLWLPGDVCDKFAERFQLTYNSSIDLYTVNASAHQFNAQQNATVSFKIGSGPDDSNTFTTIILPYDAFNLQVDYPIVDNATNYFPIKRSTKGDFVLGRTFLQEAYIVVDYERANFTVAPAYYSEPMPDQNLIPIYNTSFPTASQTPKPSDGGLSPGAVAGIVVGIVVALLLACLAAFFWWKKQRQQKKAYEKDATTSEIDTVVAGNEVKHRRVSELDSEPPGSPKPPVGGYYGDRDQKDGIPFPPISEMDSPPAELYSPPPGSGTPNSMNGSDYFIAGNRVRRRGATRESSGNNTPGTPAPIAELPGDDGKFQVGGQHFEPVASPKMSPVHSRGPSDSSLHTNIDEVVTRTDASPERSQQPQPSEEAKTEGSEAKAGGEAEPEAGALERRPSHARGLSDTTVQSDSTAVSQPTPEELEAWAMGRDDGPQRPLSE